MGLFASRLSILMRGGATERPCAAEGLATSSMAPAIRVVREPFCDFYRCMQNAGGARVRRPRDSPAPPNKAR